MEGKYVIRIIPLKISMILSMKIISLKQTTKLFPEKYPVYNNLCERSDIGQVGVNSLLLC